MHFQRSLISLLALSLSSFAIPTRNIEERQQSQCGQYDQITSGPYTLYTDEWGAGSATSGSQCSQINSVSGNTIAWSTTWTWEGSPNQVKSYTHVQASTANQQLSEFKSMTTSWDWSYTGTSIVANVAYDTFLGNSSSGANAYEVMVWIGNFGGNSPLSANGYPPTPIATPTIGNTPFNLIFGYNGDVQVYSFVAQSENVTSYSGDILAFYKYLAANGKISMSTYLQSIQAGTEIFTGSNAKLTTSAYSIVVE